MSNCCVYIATKMSGRDKLEMIERAKYVCSILKQYALNPISPVLEEKVEESKGPLIQTSQEQLKEFWKRDKDIIAYEAHVVLCDEAYRKSIGVEREYGFNRYALWKPTVTISPGEGFTVADFEDDIVVKTVQEAAEVIRDKWGTSSKRRIWRLKMLIKTLPKWLYRQGMAWR